MLGGSVVSSLSACAPRPREPKRRVIIVLTIDSLGTSRIGAYGYSRPTTPELDRFARQSFQFTRAFSESSWTKPSMASFFLARPVREHLVVFHLHSALTDTAVLDSLRKVAVGTKSQKMQAIARGMSVPPHLEPFHAGLDGFKKAALVNNPQVGEAFGFNRGWNVFRGFRSKLSPRGGGVPDAATPREVAASRMNRRAFRFLDNHPEGDLYLWMHHNDVHWPYGPAAGHAALFDSGLEREQLRLRDLHEHLGLVQRARTDARSRLVLSALYDAGLRSFDDELGAFFKGLRERGLFDEAAIIVTADHGEEFWDHGHFGHGNDLFGVTTSIPLLLKLPYQERGRIVAEPVSLMDIGPTVLHMAGKTADLLPGRSLLPVVGERRSYGRAVVSELVKDGYEITLVRLPHKLRLRFSEDTVIEHLNRGATGSLEPDLVQVYDLDSDPGEVRPLASRQAPGLVARLREELHGAVGGRMSLSARLQEEVEAGRANLSLPLRPEIELHRDVGEQLRALGYL
jgi:arylsulfatase